MFWVEASCAAEHSDPTCQQPFPQENKCIDVGLHLPKYPENDKCPYSRDNDANRNTKGPCRDIVYT